MNTKKVIKDILKCKLMTKFKIGNAHQSVKTKIKASSDKEN